MELKFLTCLIYENEAQKSGKNFTRSVSISVSVCLYLHLHILGLCVYNVVFLYKRGQKYNCILIDLPCSPNYWDPHMPIKKILTQHAVSCSEAPWQGSRSPAVVVHHVSLSLLSSPSTWKCQPISQSSKETPQGNWQSSGGCLALIPAETGNQWQPIWF